jgi:LSD1 subclass zinc finger protein
MPLVVRCHTCREPLQVTEALIGKHVRCPLCKGSFIVSAPDDRGPSATPETERMRERVAEPPSRRPRRDFDDDDHDSRRQRRRRRDDYGDDENDDDEDDYDDRPQSRRRRDDEAQSAALAPAIVLIVLGSIGIVVAFLYLLVVAVSPGPNGPGPQNVAAFRLGQIAAVVLAFCWAGIVLSGAIQMKNKRSYGYAVTAAVVAMLPCNLACLGGLPIGIWALVVLCRQDVKDEFR